MLVLCVWQYTARVVLADLTNATGMCCTVVSFDSNHIMLFKQPVSLQRVDDAG